jgi:hypothetical protein
MINRLGSGYAILSHAAWRSARALSLAGVLLGCLDIAPTAAKADVFNVSATVGDIDTGPTFPSGPYTGLTVTGTVNLDTANPGTVNSISLTVSGDPNIFTGAFGCPTVGSCTFFFNNSFAEDGLLDIGSPIGYTGGALLSDSFIQLVTPLGTPIPNPPGSNPNYQPEVQYLLSGTLTDQTVDAASTPEPRFEALALAMIGLLVVSFRRFRRPA